MLGVSMHVWTQKGQCEETSVRPGGKEGAVECRTPSRLRYVLEGDLLACRIQKKGGAGRWPVMVPPPSPPHTQRTPEVQSLLWLTQDFGWRQGTD